jgi:hypothetical protein
MRSVVVQETGRGRKRGGRHAGKAQDFCNNRPDDFPCRRAGMPQA